MALRISSPDGPALLRNGKIVAALTCPVCLDLCNNPKILPKCGHTLCADCLEPIYGQYEIADNWITTFPCPECRAENSVPTGDLGKLKTNYPVLRAVEVLRDEEKVVKSSQRGVTCPHANFLTKSSLSICRHCDQSFCECCLSEHKEFIKLEITFLNSGFHDRSEGAIANLPEKVDAIRRQIDENVRLVQEQISCASEAVVEAFRNAIFERRDRLSEKAKLLGFELHNRLTSEAETNGVFVKQPEIDRRLEELNETSILYGCLEDYVELHQLVIDQDKKISKLEQVDQSQVDLSNIAFSSNIVNSVTDLLASAWKFDVKLMSDSEAYGEEEKVAGGACSEVHLAAKSGDLTKLRSIFTRPNLPRICRRFVVEHRDQSDNERTLLHQVAEAGSLEAVRYLVTEQSANVLTKDGNGDTPIHLAARSNHPEIVRLLLDSTKPELVNAESAFVGSILMISSGQQENLDLVRYLVDDLKADFEQVEPKSKWTPLMFAAKRGNLDIVKFLCERGANLLAKSSSTGSTALHLAADSGHLEIVTFLLEKTCENLEWAISDGKETPLCIAAMRGHLDIVEYLVTVHQANLEHLNSEGYSPLFLAAEAGALPVVKCLLEKGADLLAMSNGRKGGRALIHVAVRGGCVELAQFLFDKCPDFLEMKDEHFNGKVMHWAAASGSLEIVKLLVEKYAAEINIRDKFGTSPLCDAVRSSASLPVIKYLLENGASLQDEDCNGENALHHAIKSKNAELIAFLAEHDPTLATKPNEEGETPLEMAKSQNLPGDILTILKRASLSQS